MSIQSDMAGWSARLKAAASEAQTELSRTALEDCNKFCKFDTGELKKSSYEASDFSRGLLIWNTAYARHAYFMGEADRTKNPLASKLWAHKAAALYSARWMQAAKKRFITAIARAGKGGII